jgi:hypothetical protein
MALEPRHISFDREPRLKWLASSPTFAQASSTPGDLVVTMQDCANAGANVISMSLGGSYSSRAEERMVSKLTRQESSSQAALTQAVSTPPTEAASSRLFSF